MQTPSVKHNKKKRFIAGALCPQCHRIDTIALCQAITGKEYIICVRCDYYYDQADAAPSTPPVVSKQTSSVKPVIWHKSIKS